jgi:PEP-CTERM motif
LWNRTPLDLGADNNWRRERREAEMPLNARSTPIAFAWLAFFTGISTHASADIVGFPGLEWSQGSLLVVGSDGSKKSVPFNGPEVGPSETLSLAALGGSAELFGSLVPFPAIQASAGANSAIGANSVVELDYHVEIQPLFEHEPEVTNIHLIASVQATSTGSGSSSASLSLLGLKRPTEASTLLYEAASVQGTAEGGFSQDVPIDTVIAEQEDSIFEVQMLVSASAASMGSANGVVDPIFTVPAGYRLKFSPGIGTGVPEPSTWAMMALGFAGLSFVGYRRAKQPRAA